MAELVEVVLEQCPSPPLLISKKLSNAVRLIVFMIQKRSRKLQASMMPDLQVMVRRGKILGKSFNDLMLRHNTALGCTSHDVRMSFVSPREYEFSCTSSPPQRRCTSSSRHVAKRNRGRYGRSNRIIPQSPAFNYGDVDRDDVVLPVGSFKMFKVDSPPVSVVSSSSRRVKTAAVEASSASSLSFRSAWSGGTEEDGEGGFHVDKAAEEFIERFYRELMMQKWNLAREAEGRFV